MQSSLTRLAVADAKRLTVFGLQRSGIVYVAVWIHLMNMKTCFLSGRGGAVYSYDRNSWKIRVIQGSRRLNCVVNLVQGDPQLGLLTRSVGIVGDRIRRHMVLESSSPGNARFSKCRFRHRIGRSSSMNVSVRGRGQAVKQRHQTHGNVS